MSLSLPATAISFDLYSSCAFESALVSGPQLDENEGVLFDDSASSGPSVAPPRTFDDRCAFLRSISPGLERGTLGAALMGTAISEPYGGWQSMDCCFMGIPLFLTREFRRL